MDIPKHLLTQLLSLGFDRGHEGTYELRSQDVDEIVKGYQKGTDAPWITMKVKELSELAMGSRIFHSWFGYGVVSKRRRGDVEVKNVEFPGFRADLTEDTFPWNCKIQLL